MEYTPLFAFNGINRYISSFMLEGGELSNLQNYSLDKIGILKKSYDYTKKGSTITGGYDILGGIDFFRSSGTHDHIVAVDGPSSSNIYKYSGSSWTSQGLTLTAGNRVRFEYVPTIDTLFYTNFVDSVGSYDGSTWSTSTNVTGAPKGKIPIYFGSRMYLFNVDVSGTLYPDRGYRSSLIDTGATWDADDYFFFGDVITGAGLNGDNLMVFCESSAHILTLADEKYPVSNKGCVSHEGIVSYGKWTFYPSRDGYYGFNGAEDVNISLPLKEYWDALTETNLRNIQASLYREHVYVYVGDVTIDGETITNVVFDYNILQNNWTLASLKSGVKNMHNYVTTSGKKLFFGDDNGAIYQLFSGSGQQDGNNYSSSIETHWMYGSSPLVLDDFYEIWGFGNDLSAIKVFYKTEINGDWLPLGELTEDTDVVKFHKRAYRIKFKFIETSGKNLFDIERFDIGYEPGYERITDDDK